MNFYHELRLIRQQSELSLREVARRVGVTPTYLSKIERNEESTPSSAFLDRLARALSQDPDYFHARANKIPDYIIAKLRQPRSSWKPIAEAIDKVNGGE